MNAELLVGIVKILKDNNVKLDSNILSEIVDKFVECGITVDNLEECYGVDDNLDLILDETCELDPLIEDEEDEWPDGGREYF